MPAPHRPLDRPSGDRPSLARRSAGLGVAAGLAVVALSATGCRVEPIDLPAPREWRTYEHPALGVALDVPDFFAVREDAGGALFRIHGANAVLLRFVDEQEAKHRGLWVGTAPTGPITLGGRAGQRFVYKHGDGPVWSQTEAYVVPYRGKQLGLEFRTRHDEDVRERMLASFRFVDGATAATLRGSGAGGSSGAR